MEKYGYIATKKTWNYHKMDRQIYCNEVLNSGKANGQVKMLNLSIYNDL
jgi:hypothetical protein